MEHSYAVVHLSDVTEYLENIEVNARVSIVADMSTMAQGYFDEVDTKQLKGHVRELRSGPHRISYFAHGTTLYFIQAWRKKNQKTKKKYIEYAEQLYQHILYEEHNNKKKNKRTH